MPIALLALTISAFAIGTTAFVIADLLPTIAADLSVSLPAAGLLVSLYALGVAVGAPMLTALTDKVPRKALLLGLMTLFTIGNMVAWQAPGYESLIVARMPTGLAHGVFFSIGPIIAASVVLALLMTVRAGRLDRRDREGRRVHAAPRRIFI